MMPVIQIKNVYNPYTGCPLLELNHRDLGKLKLF